MRNVRHVQKKDLQSSVTEFNKFKRILLFLAHIILMTHFIKNVKFAFKIHLSQCSFDVIMTSSKMMFSGEGSI